MKKKTAKIILDAAIVIFSLLLIVSAVRFITLLGEYKRGENVYSDIMENAVELVFEDEDEQPADVQTEQPAISAAPEAIPADAEPVTSAQAETKAAVPETTTAKKKSGTLKIDFNALKSINENIIAWIYSPDTPISYPIVRAHTDADYDYWLKHLPNGTYNKLGTLFTDDRIEPFKCPNTIIYGHNMLNSSMFSTLLGYRKQSYYDAHPYIYILTPEKTMKVEIFSAFTIEVAQSPYTVDFDSDGKADSWRLEEDSAADKAYAEFIAQLKKLSDFKSDVNPDKSRRLVTFSTCDNGNDNNRYVVYGMISE